MPTKPTTAASRPDSRLVEEIRTLVDNSSDDAIWSIGAAALARMKELLVSGPFGLVPNSSCSPAPMARELITNVAPDTSRLTNAMQPTGEDLRVASEVAGLLRALNSGQLFALVGGRAGLDALKVAAAALVGKPSPVTTTNAAPAPNTVAGAFAANRAKHAGEFAGYSINATAADSDPALAHLDSIGRRMVAELRANNIEVPDVRNEVAIFNAYTEMQSAGAREQLAMAETKLRYLRHLGGGQGA